MGTKPALLVEGDRMWLRAAGGRHGQACWIVADQQAGQLSVQIHLDDGSGRPRIRQMADPAGTRRHVGRGQLVAFGTATWFRESHKAQQAEQAALELAQLQASRLAAKEASAAETETRKVMDAAEKAWLADPAAWTDYHTARAAHDAAWRHSQELAMRLPIVHVLDPDGGYRHLTEAEAAHQHWLDEFTRTAAALEATHGTQV